MRAHMPRKVRRNADDHACPTCGFRHRTPAAAAPAVPPLRFTPDGQHSTVEVPVTSERTSGGSIYHQLTGAGTTQTPTLAGGTLKMSRGVIVFDDCLFVDSLIDATEAQIVDLTNCTFVNCTFTHGNFRLWGDVRLVLCTTPDETARSVGFICDKPAAFYDCDLRGARVEVREGVVFDGGTIPPKAGQIGSEAVRGNVIYYGEGVKPKGQRNTSLGRTAPWRAGPPWPDWYRPTEVGGTKWHWDRA